MQETAGKQKMRNLKSLLKKGTEILKNAEIEEAGQNAWLLLEYTAGISRAYYYAHDTDEIPIEIEEAFLKLCTMRAEHIPLQHLVHRAYFMEYEFYVDENVLIPRQDTEILVETARNILKDRKSPKILDMCTGSGCILISLLAYQDDCTGVGADISSSALAVAKKNAESIGVEKKALFVESDTFFADFFQEKDGKIPAKYDMLISNPPYIPTEEIQGLQEEVRSHDPLLALDGHEDGLYFYREITAQAQKYLKPGGWLLYEIGCGQGSAVKALMEQAGFVSIEVKKDLAGLDRVVLGMVSPIEMVHQEDDHV